jgi:hypothetical protein
VIKRDWEKAKAIRTLIAESVAMMLNGSSVAECERVQAMAEQQILIAKDQVCRGFFFRQFGTTVITIGTAASVAIGASYLWKITAINPVFCLLRAALAGSFGAFVSAMTRTRQLGLDPESGTYGLKSEARARALIGAGAAIFAYFAFHSGMLLKGAIGRDSNQADAALAFLCLVAGASERILPSLIVRGENIVDGSESKSEPTTGNRAKTAAQR